MSDPAQAMEIDTGGVAAPGPVGPTTPAESIHSQPARPQGSKWWDDFVGCVWLIVIGIIVVVVYNGCK